MRKAVAIAVTVLNAAGPWLCCCVLACGATPATRAADCRAKKVCSTCSNCCKDCSSGPCGPPAKAPTREPCKNDPCQQRVCCFELAVLPAPSETVHESSAKSYLHPPADLPPDKADRFVDTVDQFVSELPFLPTQVRLRAHHALRC